MKMKYKVGNINIDTELGTEFADEGPWRSYQLTASGDSLDTLLESATITEIDQDGGELRTYGLEDAPSDVERDAYSLILRRVHLANEASQLGSGSGS